MVVFSYLSYRGREQLPYLKEPSEVGFFGLKKVWLWASTAEIYKIQSAGRGGAHRSFIQEPGGIRPSTWEVQKQSRGDGSSQSAWVIGSSSCHRGPWGLKPAWAHQKAGQVSWR